MAIHPKQSSKEIELKPFRLDINKFLKICDIISEKLKITNIEIDDSVLDSVDDIKTYSERADSKSVNNFSIGAKLQNNETNSNNIYYSDFRFEIHADYSVFKISNDTDSDLVYVSNKVKDYVNKFYLIDFRKLFLKIFYAGVALFWIISISINNASLVLYYMLFASPLYFYFIFTNKRKNVLYLKQNIEDISFFYRKEFLLFIIGVILDIILYFALKSL